MSRLTVCLLGPPQIELDGQPVSLGTDLPITPYTGPDSASGEWDHGTPADFVGRNRPYRFCVGGGGQSWHNLPSGPGGVGGGILLIYAPAIQFGPNAAISANGGDGVWDASDAV